MPTNAEIVRIVANWLPDCFEVEQLWSVPGFWFFEQAGPGKPIRFGVRQHSFCSGQMIELLEELSTVSRAVDFEVFPCEEVNDHLIQAIFVLYP